MSAEHENIIDEIREQNLKFREMTPRQKFQYFWDYYKIPALAILLVLFFLITFTRDYIEGKKETRLYAVFIGANTLNDYEALCEDFAAYAGIDLTQNHVVFDTSVQPGTSNYEMEMASTQKMMAMASAGNMDAIVADETSFSAYADAGYYLDLRTVLSKEQLTAYKDAIYYYTYDQEAAKKAALENNMPYEESLGPYDTLDAVPIGIRLSALCHVPSDTYPADADCLFGFCVNSTHTEEALTLLSFLEGK